MAAWNQGRGISAVTVLPPLVSRARRVQGRPSGSRTCTTWACWARTNATSGCPKIVEARVNTHGVAFSCGRPSFLGPGSNLGVTGGLAARSSGMGKMSHHREMKFHPGRIRCHLCSLAVPIRQGARAVDGMTYSSSISRSATGSAARCVTLISGVTSRSRSIAIR